MRSRLPLLPGRWRIVLAWLALTGATTALGTDGTWTRHVVQPGDTVPRLAWRYRLRVEAIRAANGLSGDTLAPGAVLRIPPTSEAVLAPRRAVTTAATPAAAAPIVAETMPSPPLEIAPRRAVQPPAPPEPTLEPERRAVRALPSPPIPKEDRQVSPYTRVLSANAGGNTLPRSEPPPVAPRPPIADPNTPSDEPGFSSNAAPPSPVPPGTRERRAPAPEPASPAESSAPGPRRDGSVAAFTAAATRLADRRISYNGSWTPPGESRSWTMDCSNTCRWLYRDAAGIELPRTASDQYVAMDRAGRLWKAPKGLFSSKIDTEKLRRRLKPGDLLFWENTYKPVRRPDITHVMLYLGQDEVGRWLMAGSQRSRGVSVYEFDATKTKGGYRTFFGLFKHEGRFVAYGRPLGK